MREMKLTLQPCLYSVVQNAQLSISSARYNENMILAAVFAMKAIAKAPHWEEYTILVNFISNFKISNNNCLFS